MFDTYSLMKSGIKIQRGDSDMFADELALSFWAFCLRFATAADNGYGDIQNMNRFCGKG